VNVKGYFKDFKIDFKITLSRYIYCAIAIWKNDFAEIYLKVQSNLKIISLNYHNNYVRISSMMSNGRVQQRKQLSNCYEIL